MMMTMTMMMMMTMTMMMMMMKKKGKKNRQRKVLPNVSKRTGRLPTARKRSSRAILHDEKLGERQEERNLRNKGPSQSNRSILKEEEEEEERKED